MTEMSMIRIAAATLVAGLIALPGTFAQAAPNPANTGGQSRAQAAFDRIDTNKDGFIDRAEMRAARMALFDRLDTDKDGKLTAEEMRAGRPARNQRAGNAQRTISRDEFIARADQSLARRDTDKDGKLSFAEFSQRRTRPAPAPTPTR
jgi:Ca2+-binding EF-hand superfamily protein